ncbi:Rad4 family protein [Talaromyces stipitatus ATCC 10500]|uniref:Rad4 family protein n=1 Tax=Talaromyces stipitatus (strain ATCC 10500 / CBS 375.48 / QM 6759 / NRRL 1006) TaxID=441959 RepID=B8M404_TALSN|nr:Rad4 family protein [Talaromyces stipitatus ATCC 10500]EED20747.1 Rad4 family protein [Talaromyces stipitatus ATCC 10500]
MPPFIPTKRSISPPNRPSPPAKRPATKKQVVQILESSDSSLSDVSSDEERSDVKKPLIKSKGKEDNVDSVENDDHDEESVDWEDAMDTTTPSAYASHATPAQDVEIRDLELTLDPMANVRVTSLLDTKKGPSQIERAIRLNTHKAHVQCLLFHNAIRNAWLNDKKVHDILRGQLPAGIQKEVQRWRVASALDPPPPPPPQKNVDTKTKADKKKGSKKKQAADTRNWGEEAKRLEPGQPDMSHGDPILQLLRVLAAYWKRNFKVTAPGLRKHGYCSAVKLEAIVSSFKNGDHNPLVHGERISDRHEFRILAEKRQGSRDVGAQLFTALLRSLGIEARLVSNLQPLGFGWTKAEVDTSEPVQSSENAKNAVAESSSDEEIGADEEGDAEGKSAKARQLDRDLPFPVYWTEVVSPITHEVIPVDPLILSNPVAATPEMVAAFEPRGGRADKAKQVIAYVVAHSSDATAKDVTTRYLRRQTWPGRTKGYRLPMEKLTIKPFRRGPTYTIDYNWFRETMRGYIRADNQRTAADDIEDAKDLVANQPEKKIVKKETDTLQSLKASTEFVLERFLRREEALRPGAKVVRKFVTGKGDKVKEENVYRRADVLRCLSAESWHKEGRRPKIGEAPLKRVPIRAVTLMRKREVEELERQTGEKPLQGLYASYQTESIIPPPIENGIIPKNEYGNIDCFVPTMVPRGAIHIPWGGTVRICKKLGIDYAEAVTGFEFGSKMAVPVIEGVVVAEENADLVRDAWRADQEVRREKERLAHEKRILQTWRKFVMGLRIMERVRAEYGEDGDAELDNPFQRRRPTGKSADTVQKPPDVERHEHDYEEDEDHYEDANADLGGGFLLPDHDDGTNDFVVEHGDGPQRQKVEASMDVEGENHESDVGDVEMSSPSEEEYEPPPRGSNRRRRRGG